MFISAHTIPDVYEDCVVHDLYIEPGIKVQN